ncbi:hypothetical protein JCM11641_005612 [Rhodosporidiobolus odoratus]
MAPRVSHEQAEHDTLVAMQRVMYGLSALLEGQWLMYKTRPYKAFSVDWVLGDAFPRAYQAWDGKPYRVNVQGQNPVQPHRVRVLRNVPEPWATGHHLDYDAETSEKAVYIDTFEPPPTSAPQGKVHIGWRWGIHLKLARSGKYEKAVEPEEAFNIKFNGSSYVLRSPEELQVVVEHSAYTPTSRT